MKTVLGPGSAIALHASRGSDPHHGPSSLPRSSTSPCIPNGHGLASTPAACSQCAQPSTLLLTADSSLLTSRVLLKPPRLTSGLFLPPHSFQNPLYSTLFVKGYLGRFLSVCVCVCVCMCVKPSRTLSIVLFLCKVTLGGFCVYMFVCMCVHVCATFQNPLYSTLFVQGYLGWFLFLFLCVCVCTCACMHCYPS